MNLNCYAFAFKSNSWQQNGGLQSIPPAWQLLLCHRSTVPGLNISSLHEWSWLFHFKGCCQVKDAKKIKARVKRMLKRPREEARKRSGGSVKCTQKKWYVCQSSQKFMFEWFVGIFFAVDTFSLRLSIPEHNHYTIFYT